MTEISPRRRSLFSLSISRLRRRRFDGKKIVQVGVAEAIKNPKAVLPRPGVDTHSPCPLSFDSHVRLPTGCTPRPASLLADVVRPFRSRVTICSRGCPR